MFFMWWIMMVACPAGADERSIGSSRNRSSLRDGIFAVATSSEIRTYGDSRWRKLCASGSSSEKTLQVHKTDRGMTGTVHQPSSRGLEFPWNASLR